MVLIKYYLKDIESGKDRWIHKDFMRSIQDNKKSLSSFWTKYLKFTLNTKDNQINNSWKMSEPNLYKILFNK